MSLLNRPSHGLPNVLLVLYKCVLERGPLTRQRLLAVCGPPSATDVKSRMPQKTLRKWTNLGLFKINKDDVVALDGNLPKEALARETGLAALSATLRGLVLRPENNLTMWITDEEKDEDTDEPSPVLAADFTRAVCWGLALEPRFPNESSVKGMYDSGVDSLQQTTLPDTPRLLFTNDTRWAGFTAWAPFLGFGWSSVKRAIFVDPTVAIRDVLPAVFKDGDTMAADEFVNRLAVKIPVLDRGDYRLLVEARMQANTWDRPQPRHLSHSLSWAFQRLAAAGVIGLGEKSDTARLSLTGPKNQSFRSFTDVTFRGATA